jgi:hypothetical protein
VNYTIALKFINERKSEKKRRLTILSTVGLSSSALPVIMLVIFVVIMIVVLPSTSAALILPFSYAQQQQQRNAATNSAACISYDSKDNIITITCDSASLTDINYQLKDDTILSKERQQSDNGGVWLLNAGIIVAEGATFYINSTDTKWLKIVSSDGNTVNKIAVYGSLKIDSVKITSWNPEINDYAITYAQGKIPRPFIIVEDEATGTTDITN